MYGDHPALPKIEDRIGAPLSPYAVTKLVNELYATVFTRAYGLDSIGLRYFNVFGPRHIPMVPTSGHPEMDFRTDRWWSGSHLRRRRDQP